MTNRTERMVSLLGKVRRGRMERETIPSISSEWVRDHEYILTPRDIEILKLLSRFPVMTVEHLYELIPETRHRNGMSFRPFHVSIKGMSLCRQRIRRLFDYHFVNKYSPKLALGEGTSPQYIWLDRAGYKYLGLGGRPPKQLSSEYVHHSRILDVYVEVVRLQRESVIIIDYLEVCYTQKPQSFNIEPDLIVAFRKGNYGYRYLIEVDNCEKKETEELNKLNRYRDWELSSQWIKEPWADLYKKKFPTVLYMFAGAERKVNRRVRIFKERAEEIECKADCFKIEEFRNKILSLRE